jgi:proteasome lid subunit RPN8/RPN11
MEPRAQLVALEAAELAGERLRDMFHSHADVGAYLSEEDRTMALTDEGEPLP